MTASMRVRVLGPPPAAVSRSGTATAATAMACARAASARTPRTQSSIAVSSERRRLGAVQRLARCARADQGVPGAAAGARHPRHRHPRHRPGGRADRPHHRTADAARGQAAGDLVHGHGPRGSHHRQSAVQHPGPLLRRELAPPADRAGQQLHDRRHRASALHAACRSRARRRPTPRIATTRTKATTSACASPTRAAARSCSTRPGLGEIEPHLAAPAGRRPMS